MKYEVEFDQVVIDRIGDLAEQGLPDEVIGELSRRVDEQLATDPAACLQRLAGPPVVYQYNCTIIGPDRGSVHVFFLRVFFSVDEKTLRVWSGDYLYLPAD